MLNKFPNLHKSILITIALITMAVFLITACGDKEQKTEKKQRLSKKVKSKKEKKVSILEIKDKKTPDNKTVEEYFYDATGKPDPFVPLITEIFPKRKAPRKETSDKPLTPLQKYAIEELNLVAIIKSGNKLSALFEDMEEFGYIVSENTLIGNNGGIIKKITPDNVIIEEDIYNSSGETEKNIRSIKIQSQE